MKKGKALFAMLLVLTCLFMLEIHGTEVKAEASPKKLHIVFALDVSGSMNNKDPNGMALQAIKMLADMCNGFDNELGFVAYNDTIAYSYDMTACNGTDIGKLKNYISSVKYKGETDIGLGLKKAVTMSAEHADDNSDSIVILLSDGKTDLTNSKTKRTAKDSEEDMKDAIETAKNQNVTVYPIRLNNKFDTKADYLSEVAHATGGTSSVAFSPLELMDKIQSVVSQYQIPALHNIAVISGNNKLQEVKIPLSTEHVDKTRIYVVSTGKVNYVSVVGAEASVTYDKTKRYAIAEIEDMKQLGEDAVKVYFHGKKKSDIQVYTQQFYSLYPAIKLYPENERDSGKTVQFLFHDTSIDMEADDEALYQDLQIQCTLRSKEDSSERGLSCQKGKDGIEIEHAFDRIGTYQIEIVYTGDYLSGTFLSDTFQVLSKEAEVLTDVDDTVCLNDNEKRYDLSSLFGDVKSEIKEYRIQTSKGSGAKAKIDEEQLLCTISGAEDTSFVIEAEDENQDIYQVSLCLHIKSFWQMYQVLIVGCALGILIVITGIISFMTVRKSNTGRKQSNVPFVGTLIGYFMNLKSVNDLPALKWNLSDFGSAGISMSELFADAHITDRFIGADRIWFYPKSDNSIELLHNLKGSIFIGTKLISKDIPVTIYSGEKIFISFDESGIEMELKFYVN